MVLWQSSRRLALSRSAGNWIRASSTQNWLPSPG